MTALFICFIAIAFLIFVVLVVYLGLRSTDSKGGPTATAIALHNYLGANNKQQTPDRFDDFCEQLFEIKTETEQIKLESRKSRANKKIRYI